MTDDSLKEVEESVEPAAVTCLECHSIEVRPSRSSYPQDKDRLGTEGASFWRCGNCGSRFLGPFVARSSSRRKRQAANDGRPRLDRDIQFARSLKRWVFPVVVILLTVLIVIYLLDRRDTVLPTILD